MEPRIRDEIGAITVVAFALLSTVALATDQGAVLQWWRSALFALLLPVAAHAITVKSVQGPTGVETWLTPPPIASSSSRSAPIWGAET